jgi:hypothetical protein
LERAWRTTRWSIEGELAAAPEKEEKDTRDNKDTKDDKEGGVVLGVLVVPGVLCVLGLGSGRHLPYHANMTYQ